MHKKLDFKNFKTTGDFEQAIRSELEKLSDGKLSAVELSNTSLSVMEEMFKLNSEEFNAFDYLATIDDTYYVTGDMKSSHVIIELGVY